ncbi:hypothetical protein O9992_27675 [Vibrio lentus]|nr:hypothetical protein [Vibrio lentus]
MCFAGNNEWDKAETVYLELIKTQLQRATSLAEYADNFRSQSKDQQSG